MSPEQARGKQVDKRADIWAFGVVLYELLTGERLFKGEDLSETLAQVLTKEPDLGRVPVKVRRLLRRCLERDPKKRLRDIGDAADLLDDAPSGTAPSRSRLGWVASVLAIALVVLGALYWRAIRPCGSSADEAERRSRTRCCCGPVFHRRDFPRWIAAGAFNQDRGRRANARHAIVERGSSRCCYPAPRTETTRSFRRMGNGSGSSPVEK